MPDYDKMQEILAYTDERYLHVWMEVGTQQLQMDLLGAYYSDDMSTDSGKMYVVYESDFMPPDVAESDFAMLAYLKECLSGIPDGYAYDKMVVIHNMKYSDNNHKRFLVAGNVSLE